MDVAPFVGLFVICEALGMVAGVYQSLVVAFDETGVYVRQNIVAQAALLISASVLIPHYGILGVAISGVVVQCVIYVSTVFFFLGNMA